MTELCLIDKNSTAFALFRYMVITPPSQHTHALSWISKHLPEDGSVLVHDITGRYAALAVLGPMSERLLSELTLTPLDLDQFPLGHVKVSFPPDLLFMPVSNPFAL